MAKEIISYKLVRRGPRYCVRVKGTINTTDSWHWCRERNMTYHNIKQRFGVGYTWVDVDAWKKSWDYDFIFDKRTEALAFILGYL